LKVRFVSLIWFAAAAALPIAAWHGVAERLAAHFRLEAGYLVSAWSGFTLIALGLLCFVPVLVSVGRSPDSRLYPRNRRALIAWGSSLYLLGVGLTVQVAQLASLL
jgi:hypothetical protein